jgi:hypothetical protein
VVVEIRIQVVERLLAMELAEALEVAVDLTHSIISVVRLLQQVKEMLVAMVNILLLPTALVAEEVALVRLVQAVAFLGTVELVYLLLYQDQHYHMLVEVGEALI